MIASKKSWFDSWTFTVVYGWAMVLFGLYLFTDDSPIWGGIALVVGALGLAGGVYGWWEDHKTQESKLASWWALFAWVIGALLALCVAVVATLIVWEQWVRPALPQTFEEKVIAMLGVIIWMLFMALIFLWSIAKGIDQARKASGG